MSEQRDSVSLSRRLLAVIETKDSSVRARQALRLVDGLMGFSSQLSGIKPGGPGSRALPLQASEGQRFTPPGAGAGRAPVALASPDAEGGSVDVWVKTSNFAARPGNVIEVSGAGYASAADTVGIGVVVVNNGFWSKIRLAGQAYVNLDRDDNQWPPDPGTTLWKSPRVNGAASLIRPGSGRFGACVIGKKIGKVSQGRVLSSIHPPVWPVTWRRLWEYDADNYIDKEYCALDGGGWRVVFVLGGVAAMDLREDGLYLAGSLTNATYTGNPVQAADESRNGEIEWNAANESISFGVPDPATGNFVRVAELFPGGDLYAYQFTTGVAYGKASASPAYDEPCYMWNGTTFLGFSLDGGRTNLHFVRKMVGTDTNIDVTTDKIHTGVTLG